VNKAASPVWVNRYLARRTPRPPRLDGELGDAAWAEAPISDSFVVPNATGVVTVATTTRLRVRWDRRAIYLALECLDPDLGGAAGPARGAPGDGDQVEVTVQPDVTSREHLDLVVSPAGTTSGSLPARVAVRRQGSGRDRGWRIELAIPLANLPGGAVDLAGQRWGLNVSRRGTAASPSSTAAVWSRPLPAAAAPVDQCGDLIFANERGQDPSSALEDEEEEREGRR
jgi:hypothetical protein